MCSRVAGGRWAGERRVGEVGADDLAHWSPPPRKNKPWVHHKGTRVTAGVRAVHANGPGLRSGAAAGLKRVRTVASNLQPRPVRCSSPWCGRTRLGSGLAVRRCDSRAIEKGCGRELRLDRGHRWIPTTRVEEPR